MLCHKSVTTQFITFFGLPVFVTAKLICFHRWSYQSILIRQSKCFVSILIHWPSFVTSSQVFSISSMICVFVSFWTGIDAEFSFFFLETILSILRNKCDSFSKSKLIFIFYKLSLSFSFLESKTIFILKICPSLVTTARSTNVSLCCWQTNSIVTWFRRYPLKSIEILIVSTFLLFLLFLGTE